MLLLLFTIGENKYGIKATLVKEVWPLLPLKPIHRTPDYIAGLVSIRGQVVPVIDISKLYLNKQASNRISTRIILVNIKGLNAEVHTLGIIAEHVTDTIKVEDNDAFSVGIKSEGGSLIGQEILIDDQLIHMVNVDELLQKDLYDRVFRMNVNDGN